MTQPVGTASRGLLGPRLAALAVIGLGLIALVDATQTKPISTYVAVGPAVMPAVVGFGLVALGSLLFIRTGVRPDVDLFRHVAQEAAKTHWPTTGATMAALIGYAFALGLLGYVVATAVFVPISGRTLGSRQPIRDAVVGAVLGTVVYLGFTEFLGVRLPAGILEPFLS